MLKNHEQPCFPLSTSKLIFRQFQPVDISTVTVKPQSRFFYAIKKPMDKKAKKNVAWSNTCRICASVGLHALHALLGFHRPPLYKTKLHIVADRMHRRNCWIFSQIAFSQDTHWNFFHQSIILLAYRGGSVWLFMVFGLYSHTFIIRVKNVTGSFSFSETPGGGI
jgi:hypothetical protein